MSLVVVANVTTIATVAVDVVGIALVVEVVVATVDVLGTVVVIFWTVVLVVWTVVVHNVNLAEPVEIFLFVAFEVNQEAPHSFWLKAFAKKNI